MDKDAEPESPAPTEGHPEGTRPGLDTTQATDHAPAAGVVIGRVDMSVAEEPVVAEEENLVQSIALLVVIGVVAIIALVLILEFVYKVF